MLEAGSERGRRHHLQRAVRSVLVVVDPPVFDQDLRLGQAGEQLHAEQLVADATPEAFDVRVLPRRAGLDIGASGACEPTPVPKRVGGHLRPVVTAHEPGGGPAVGDEPLEHCDGLIRVDPPATLDRQRLTGELVHDMQQLQVVPVSGLIPLEVDRPHVVRPIGSQPRRGHRGLAQPLTLAPPLRHPQPLLAPQPLGALAIDLPALIEQQLMRPAIPPPRPATRDPPQL